MNGGLPALALVLSAAVVKVEVAAVAVVRRAAVVPHAAAAAPHRRGALHMGGDRIEETRRVLRRGKGHLWWKQGQAVCPTQVPVMMGQPWAW